jgi:flagellar biosynthesis protein FlhB
MSQSGTGERHEKATAHKLRKAREQGQAVRSRDIGTAIGILASIKVTLWLLPLWSVDFRQLFELALDTRMGSTGLEGSAMTLYTTSLVLLGKMLLPLAAVPACVMLASLFPGGLVWAPQMAMPKAERVSPLAGIKRLFSPKHYVQTATLLLKSALMIVLLVWITRHNLTRYAELQGVSLADALIGGSDLLVNSLLWFTAVLLLFALVDAPVQYLLFMREQRMSRHDIKEEHKTMEGRPEVKQRVRKLRQMLLRNGVRRNVPGADVVLVNPTHYAVALKYDESRAQAPYVIAKGVDEAALFIREVAGKHGVEVISVPPLARAVYHSSQVNQQVPAALYDAVAQTLIYVLQIKAFRSGKRRTQPVLPARLDIPVDMLTSDPS